MSSKLQPVRPEDIPLGVPLAWHVYDKSGNLLMREGALVENQRQIDGLCAKGLFREKIAVNRSRLEQRSEPEGKSRLTEKSMPAAQVEELLDLKIGIGDTVQLQDISSDKQRYFVRMIGFLNKRSVLVSHPRQDEKLSYIKEGAGFLVRGFAGTKTYEFNSNVINVCLTPYPYLHLAFPAQVKSINMRGAVRIKLRLVCSIESQETGAKTAAIIEDMSISGARIQAGKPFGKVGEAVSMNLRLQVAEENQVFMIAAMIRNVHQELDTQTGAEIYMHGMEFIQTQSVDLTVLQNYIYKSMLES
jgi:c-di-GMP-binding flagellar brake protein YcgR